MGSDPDIIKYSGGVLTRIHLCFWGSLKSIIFRRVPWKLGGINSDDDNHETYLNKFKSTVFSKLHNLIKRSLEDEPELKSRKKIVEVIYIVYSEIRRLVYFTFPGRLGIYLIMGMLA